jgi:hypothetical protein
MSGKQMGRHLVLELLAGREASDLIAREGERARQ